MKTFKRVLAMSLALALLLSFSPALGVSAADADNTAYNQLMHDYKPTGLTYDLTDNTNYATISGTTGAISAPDSAHLMFDNYPAGNSAYVTLRNQQTGVTTLIFEADICYEDMGLQVNFSVNGANFKFGHYDAGRFYFVGDNKASHSWPLEAGEWSKIVCVCRVNSSNSVIYDGYVGGNLVADNIKVTNTSKTISAITTVRAQVDSKKSNTEAGENGDFQIRNVNWYTPDSTGACTDANKDHICDYDVNCAQIGEHVNNNGVCDYCGESFASESKEYIVVDGAIVDEKGNVVANNEITASGVLIMNGENATVKVAEGATLAVVDTSWMTNGLSGEKAAKLTVDPESKGTVESYTQYGDFKYLKVPGENGTYTFHPFNLTITRMGLNTVKEAISLEVQFIADDVVRNLLIGENEEHAYGLKNLKTGEYKSVKENSAYQFTAQNNRAVAYFALSGSLLNENFDAEGKFQAYMKLNIGGGEVEILSNYIADITPREVMTALNNSDVAASDSQLAKIQAIWTNEDGTEKADYSELKSVLTRFH